MLFSSFNGLVRRCLLISIVLHSDYVVECDMGIDDKRKRVLYLIAQEQSSKEFACFLKISDRYNLPFNSNKLVKEDQIIWLNYFFNS